MAFYLAFTIDAAFNTLGFAQMTSHWLDIRLKDWLLSWIFTEQQLDQLLASIFLAICTWACAYGVQLSSRVSLVVLLVLLSSLIASLVCLAWPTSDDVIGHTEASSATLASNVEAELSSPRAAALGFAMIFPGFTGVIAGQLAHGVPADGWTVLRRRPTHAAWICRSLRLVSVLRVQPLDRTRYAYPLDRVRHACIVGLRRLYVRPPCTHKHAFSLHRFPAGLTREGIGCSMTRSGCGG